MPGEQKQPRLPGHWARKLEKSLAAGHKRRALRYLDRIIEAYLPLFWSDPFVREERRNAILLRVQLLREWGWFSEAMAWLCLECELDPANQQAAALKERLIEFYRLRDDEDVKPEPVRSELGNLWPGVAGMHELKAVLERDVILPLREPLLYKQYKLELPNGILLYGPPGCGKTFIARKLAERLNFSFREVKPSDIASTYVHGTQGRIASMFAEAREKAPCMLFLDELDAMIGNRGQDLYHHYATEVNEFLTQLNDAWEQRVLVIAATNRPDKIDPAARRPGRLDKKIFVGTPDCEARVELFRVYLEDRPQEGIDLLAAAELTEFYTCAEVRHIVNEAAREALNGRRSIELADIMQAVAANPPQHSAEDIEKYKRALD